MKTTAAFLFVAASVLCASAQPVPPGPPPVPEPRVASRGRHHRVWEYVVWEVDPFGERSPRTNRYNDEPHHEIRSPRLL